MAELRKGFKYQNISVRTNYFPLKRLVCLGSLITDKRFVSTPIVWFLRKAAQHTRVESSLLYIQDSCNLMTCSQVRRISHQGRRRA